MNRCFRLSTILTGVLAFFVAGVEAQALRADYQFQNSRSSSISGAPDLTDLIHTGQTCPTYCNTFAADTVDGSSRVVMQFPYDNGLSLSPTTSVLTTGSQYTIVVLFRFSDVSGFKRLIDFKHGTADTGLYVFNGTLSFYNVGVAGGTVAANTWTQAVITRDASGTVTGYVNGTQAFSFADSGQLGVIDSSNILRFFQDNTSGGAAGEASAGAVARVRVYDDALTGAQVAALDRLATGTAVPAPIGLVSWWTGDGDVLDVRSRLDGQRNENFTPGEVGQAFSFDGVSSTFVSAGSNLLNFGGNDFTVEAWTKTTSTGTARMIYANGYAGNSIVLLRIETDNRARFLIRDVNGVALDAIGTTTNLNDGSWHHISGVREGTTARLYVDGVQQTTATNPSFGQIDSNCNFAFIGAFNSQTFCSVEGVENFFDGSIDEVSLYNRALAAPEIAGIFNAGSLGKLKPTATVAPTGLVGWWAADGNANDVSGSGNNGTLLNGASFAVAKVGQGFGLDGVDDAIDIPSTVGLNVQNFTVEAWVDPTDVTQDRAILVKSTFASSGNDFAYGLRVLGGTGGRVEGRISNGTNVATVLSNTPLTVNQFQHVALTYDGVTLKIYIGGILDAAATTALAPVQNSNPVTIGAWRLQSSGNLIQNWQGVIDEASLYNRALTQAEMTSIFNAGLAGKLKSVITSAPAPIANGFVSRLRRGITATAAPNAPQSVTVTVGDATVTYPGGAGNGVTQEIPIPLTGLPALPLPAVGLNYDLATTFAYTGQPAVCFNIPAARAGDFPNLRVLHLEAGSWQDRTAASTYPNLCTVPLSSLSPFAIVTNTPTAASVTISGRVLTSDGAGLRNATVMMTDANGRTRRAVSGAFGYYTFTDVAVGGAYTFVVSARRFTFAPQIVILRDQMTGLDFKALY